MDKQEAKRRAKEMKRKNPELRYRVEPMDKAKANWAFLVWDKAGWGYGEYDL